MSSSSLLVEAINYYLVYRQDTYKKLVQTLNLEQDRLEAMKEKQMLVAGSQGISQQKIAQRKIKIREDDIKVNQQKLQQSKVKCTMVQALTSIVTLRMMYVVYEGTIAARLPFVPISLVQGLTHYGIEGDDMR